MRPHCCFSDRRESAAGPWWRSLWPVHPMGCRGHASRDKDPGLGFCLGQSRPGNAPASLCPGKGRLAWFLSVPLNIDIPAGFLFACGRVIRRDPYRPNIGQIGTNIVMFWPYCIVRITGLLRARGPFRWAFKAPCSPCFGAFGPGSRVYQGLFCGARRGRAQPLFRALFQGFDDGSGYIWAGAFEAVIFMSSPFFSVAWPLFYAF